MEDDWYRASTAGGFRSQSGTKGKAQNYLPEEPASPLGCVEQFQYCNLALPNGSRCGPLGSFNDAIVGAAPFFNFTTQEMEKGSPPLGNREATRLFWMAMISSSNPLDLGSLLHQMAAKSLASQSQLFDGVQYGSSPTQWQTDVTNWFASILAALQAAYVSTAIGPSDKALENVRIPPADTLQQELCESQVSGSLSVAGFL